MSTGYDWRRWVPKQWQRWLDESPAPRPQSRRLELHGVDEDRPGSRWKALYRETWPEYERWWLSSGERPSRQEAEAAFEEHMPELMPMYRRMVELTGDDDTAAAMLTLWNPPAFIVACSQAVVPDAQTGEPVLIRNYDYDPHLFESTIHRARWGSRRVMGTGDCLWGLLDGVNDQGLALSLTFGGRSEVGEGFGIPVVLRYVLETCDDAAAGVEVLRRLPHQLSYNVTLCDRDGAVATVRIAPDRLLRVTDRRTATNHPDEVEWPTHAAFVHSEERLELLDDLCENGADADTVVAAMLAPPMLARRWEQGFVTLYTAAYRPASERLTYHWPGHSRELRLDQPLPGSIALELDSDEPAAAQTSR
jgi:predicted choloylglycine hydrolase